MRQSPQTKDVDGLHIRRDDSSAVSTPSANQSRPLQDDPGGFSERSTYYACTETLGLKEQQPMIRRASGSQQFDQDRLRLLRNKSVDGMVVTVWMGSRIQFLIRCAPRGDVLRNTSFRSASGEGRDMEGESSTGCMRFSRVARIRKLGGG